MTTATVSTCRRASGSASSLRTGSSAGRRAGGAERREGGGGGVVAVRLTVIIRQPLSALRLVGAPGEALARRREASLLTVRDRKKHAQ